MSSDAELTKLAAAALLQEAVLGATRASIAGPSGWKKPNRCAPNKAFLKNTLKGVLSSNRMRDRKIVSRSEEKRQAHETRLREQNKYKKLYISASTKSPRKNGVIDGGSNIRVPMEDCDKDRPAPITILHNSKTTKETNRNMLQKDAQSIVWTDDDCLELQPVTKKSLKIYQKEKSLQRARKMFRPLNFVPGTSLDLSLANQT